MRNIVEKNVDELTPSEYSHKTANAIESLKESIDKFGIQQPSIIDDNNRIIAGNAVYKAAVEYGYKTIPCVVVTDLSEQEIRKYRIVDNKTGEFAQWNEEKLNKELSYLQNPNDLQFCFDEDLFRRLNPFASFAPKGKSSEPRTDSDRVHRNDNLDERFVNRLKLEEEKSKVKII